MRARRTIGDDSPLNPHTPCRAARCPPFSADRAPRARARTASLRSPGAAWECRGGVAMGGVTPRQACPRPSGLGRNLRSKTRWFTGFCNSHQVSHFATFFIDARAEISVAESRLKGSHRRAADPRVGACVPGRGAPAPGGAAALSASRFLGARRAQRVVSEPAGTRAAGVAPRAARRGRRSRGTGSPVVVLETAMILPQVHLRKPCYDFSFL
ncbi:hypothetical protein AAC387_Pa12g0261 [Persea americana]